MQKNEMLKLVMLAFFLVILGGTTNSIACDFSEGSDQDIQKDKIINSSLIHTNNSVELMYCEGTPYNDQKDKIIIATSKIIHETTGTMYSEGIF